jgi:hypothetical protein
MKDPALVSRFCSARQAEQNLYVAPSGMSDCIVGQRPLVGLDRICGKPHGESAPVPETKSNWWELSHLIEKAALPIRLEYAPQTGHEPVDPPGSKPVPLPFGAPG